MSNVMELEKKYHMQTYGRYPILFVKGEKQFLYDNKGKKYLDFLSGLGVTSIGHSNPAVIKAVENQLTKLTHVSNLFFTEPQAKLAKKLVDISIKNGQVFFANSGAEANEAAVKLVRRWAKTGGRTKPEIITAYNSFHGRTLKMLAATGQPDKQKPFEPLPPGFKHVAFNDLKALKKAITPQTAAVMLEVIQGEGGVYCADKVYLKEVATLCKQKNMLLVFDEVQTGLSRTGKLFSYENFAVMPDIVTIAKALGNGFPIGACIAKKKIASIFKEGDHGSTFGGGPIPCTAALAVLDYMSKKKLADKAADIGKYLKKLIGEQLGDYIEEIRGLGLMLGLKTKEAYASQVTVKALENGLIVNNIGERTVRLLPPLIIGKSDCKKAVDILKKVFKELS